MAIKFFLRNSPDVIKSAVDLSREDFIEKYSDTTASKASLFKAYDEIRAIHLPKDQTKSVKFKVIQTDKKVIPITKPVVKEDETGPDYEPLSEGERIEGDEEDLPELSHEEEQEEIMMQAANLRDRSRYGGGMLNEGELKDFKGTVESISYDQLGKGEQISGEVEIVGSGKTVLDPVRVKKSNRGRRRLKNADQRDAKILELLKKGVKGQDIVKQLTQEGFSVFAPQVTQIKQANLAEINKALDELEK